MRGGGVSARVMFRSSRLLSPLCILATAIMLSVADSSNSSLGSVASIGNIVLSIPALSSSPPVLEVVAEK